MPVHTAVARNFAEASENKIHSDDIAKRFGFTGALVPGVTVFGHLAWPLTQRLGESWLQSSWVTTRFIKPAYHGETITYQRRVGSWLAVSGYREGESFYWKSNLACRGTRWHTIDLQYPRDAKKAA